METMPIADSIDLGPIRLMATIAIGLVGIARLRQIIGLAYAIQRVRVQGGPSWLDTEQYVIAAKAESADASWDQVRTMLQTLLADRFKLAVHRETKELDVYSLAVGKNGPKLQEA